MSTLEHKVVELNAAIEREVRRLGLIFVSGPGPDSFPPELSLCRPEGASVGNAVNGQPRGVYAFAVAEAVAEAATEAMAIPVAA
jgi:hypothetical protein